MSRPGPQLPAASSVASYEEVRRIELEAVRSQRDALAAALREIADIAPTDEKARGFEYGKIARAALAQLTGELPPNPPVLVGVDLAAGPDRQVTFPPMVQVLRPFVGRDVTLSLRFRDLRTRTLQGRLLAVNEAGGVVDDVWPTAFSLDDVVDCTVGVAS